MPTPNAHLRRRHGGTPGRPPLLSPGNGNGNGDSPVPPHRRKSRPVQPFWEPFTFKTRGPLYPTAFLLLCCWTGVLFPQMPESDDLEVRTLGTHFHRNLTAGGNLTVSNRGVLKRDRDTLFWSLFTDKFGSNPNTPYMWNAMPYAGFLLPTMAWTLGKHDAVVLISRKPPPIEYFSFTTFALYMPKRGLPFSSLGDSVNNLNIKTDEKGLFAHVVTANAKTYALVEKALVASGLPPSAINLAAVPSDVGLFDQMTHFETVLRLFRFRNQTEGDRYLRSHHPTFYISARHGEDDPLPTPSYKERKNADSVRERHLEPDFEAYGASTVARVGEAFERRLPPTPPLVFAPLFIRGLECLRSGTECLGDCPDAAYFGPNILEDSDDIEALQITSDRQLHVVTLVNHRLLNVSSYGSIALLKSNNPTLSKTRMDVRATSHGVTTFDLPAAAQNRRFVSWAFTRNPAHCERLAEISGAVDGCSLIRQSTVRRNGFLTYCERLYLNPVTGTGPDEADVLPARLYRITLDAESGSALPPLPSGLPPPMPLPTVDAAEPLRFLHIIKTGGESLERHLAGQTSPRLDFSPCRAASVAAGAKANTSASKSCLTAAAGVSTALCGLNCECCAADIRKASGGFHGTLLRSPRAHALSQFSHCHVAHHGSWRRSAADVPLFFAESILRATEFACGSYCTSLSTPDWRGALAERLAASKSAEEASRPLQVISMHNTQAHALTCSKARGSLGHHFKLIDGGDSLAPELDDVLTALHRFEWVGLTDAFEPSLCLLHYQANGTVPPACDCNSPARRDGSHQRLGHWVETRSERREPESLPEELLAQIDSQTAVDAQLFAAALRLLIGRLRTAEEQSGVSLLRCIDWEGLWKASSYIPGLWAGPGKLLPAK